MRGVAFVHGCMSASPELDGPQRVAKSLSALSVGPPTVRNSDTEPVLRAEPGRPLSVVAAVRLNVRRQEELSFVPGAVMAR